MVKAIQDEGLDLQRYNAIARAQQSGNKELEVSGDEIEKIKAINSKLIEIESETKKTLEKKVSANNLTLERYQEIMGLVQNDEKLQIKLQEHLKK